jgi:hypothetical protein
VVKVIVLRNTGNATLHVCAIEREPVLKWNCLSEVHVTKTKLLRARLVLHSDYVTRLTLVTWDINALAVHLNVSVVDELTCSGTGVTQSKAIADIVETELKELAEHLTSHPTATACLCIIQAELLLKHTELETKLLLLSESDCVVRLLAATCADTVLPRRECTTFEGFRRSE